MDICLPNQVPSSGGHTADLHFQSQPASKASDWKSEINLLPLKMSDGHLVFLFLLNIHKCKDF